MLACAREVAGFYASRFFYPSIKDATTKQMLNYYPQAEMPVLPKNYADLFS